jgi:hypothetical protein
MKYKQQLLELILDDNEDALIDWISAQPLLDQPEIFRELKKLAEDAAKENGDEINSEVSDFINFEDKINNFEETILDEKLAEAEYLMALEEQEKVAKQMSETVEGMREYVIECIITNAPNADAMRELAKQIIKFETDAGTYDPENWKGLN